VVLAAIAIVVLARTDDRVRREADLEEAAGCPVLTTVSDESPPGGSIGARDAFATLALSLNLRLLRTRKGAAARRNGHPARILLLASPGPAEGTADVALGLALALRDMGKRVIAIEADLRAPSFAERLGLGPVAGLAGILGGARTLEDELVEISWPRGDGAAWVVPGGGAITLPQPRLAAPAMRMLVAQARAIADVVLLAGAPAADFGDSYALTPLTDAVLLVARLDVTRRDDVTRVVRELEALERPPLGAVATTGQVRRPVAVEAAEPAGAESNGSAAASPTSREVTLR
jgi:tyrosine-protein kinase